MLNYNVLMLTNIDFLISVKLYIIYILIYMLIVSQIKRLILEHLNYYKSIKL